MPPPLARDSRGGQSRRAVPRRPVRSCTAGRQHPTLRATGRAGGIPAGRPRQAPRCRKTGAYRAGRSPADSYGRRGLVAAVFRPVGKWLRGRRRVFHARMGPGNRRRSWNSLAAPAADAVPADMTVCGRSDCTIPGSLPARSVSRRGSCTNARPIPATAAPNARPSPATAAPNARPVPCDSGTRAPWPRVRRGRAPRARAAAAAVPHERVPHERVPHEPAPAAGASHRARERPSTRRFCHAAAARRESTVGSRNRLMR